jgi:hypothetical protein
MSSATRLGVTKEFAVKVWTASISNSTMDVAVKARVEAFSQIL